jgi:hypothetical protein
VEYLKDVVSALMEVNRRQIGFVFTIFSGTNARSLHNLLKESSSGTPPAEIPLPLLEVSHMREVLLDLASRGGGGGVTRLDAQLEFMLQVVGGVPRYVEILAFLFGENGARKFNVKSYCDRLSSMGKVPVLLEELKDRIKTRYGEQYSSMVQGLPLDAIVALTLFAWPVAKTALVGEETVAELEECGILFLQPGANDCFVARLPLVLLLFSVPKGTSTAMLLRHFDVMLSPDENERNSLAIVSMKCRGLVGLGGGITLGDLFPMEAKLFSKLDQKWSATLFKCKDYAPKTAENQITMKTWDRAYRKLRNDGALVKNARNAEFADMVLIGYNGTIVFIQEKQREAAKGQQIDCLTVPTLKIQGVRDEHKKCNVQNSHLFVLITDEQFTAYDSLTSNEIVISYKEHEAMMGALLALLRKFNHKNHEEKIAVQ